MPVQCTCSICHRVIARPPSRATELILCSPACRRAYNQSRNITLVCPVCSQQFQRPMSHPAAKHAAYCSISCRRSLEATRKIKQSCTVCGRAFQSYISDHATTCSLSCAGKYRWPDSQDRFWSTVDKSGSCWLWTGDTSGGYGRIQFNGEKNGVHRFALELRLGRPIRKGFMALHTCDNPPCVRNDGEPQNYVVNGIVRMQYGHLFEGTTIDNAADRDAKGRLPTGDMSFPRLHPERLARGERNGARVHPERRPRGELQGSAKLTDDAVREIRQRATEGRHVAALLAAKYGVSASAIRRARRQDAWKHLS